MRVLQVVHNYAGEPRGGTERYTEGLAQGLAARHHVEVFTTEVDREALAWTEREIGGIPVTILSQPRARSITDRFRIQREVHRRFEAWAGERRFDVVHVQHLIDIAPSLLTVPHRLGVPCIVSLHDFWLRCPRISLIRKDGTVCASGPVGGLACIRHCSPATSRDDREPGAVGRPGPRDAAFVARYLRLARYLGRVDRFVAPSNFTRDTHARLGLDPARVSVIPWGMPAVERAPRVERAAGEPLRTAFLGQISWLKGADLAVEAFAGLDPSVARLTLHGAFNVHEAERLRARIDAVPAARWAGPYRREELSGILAASDVVVVPSRALENFPLVVQEAFQQGVPVVASRAGALPEVMRDGVDGLTFDGADGLRRAIERLATEPGLLDRLREGAPAVKPLDVHVAEIETLYADLRAPRT